MVFFCCEGILSEIAAQLHFGMPSQNQHFPQEMVDLCLLWSGWGDRQQVAQGGVPVSACPWHKVPLSLAVNVFLQSTQKGKGEENPCMDMIFWGSCRTTWCRNRPFSQAHGQRKPSGDVRRHPTSWKGGHSLLFSGVSILSLGFYVHIPLGSLSTEAQKTAI